MVKKQASLTTIMVVQQLEEEFWLSSDYKQPLQQAKDGNSLPLLEQMVKKLEKDDITSTEAYIIKHDKDTHQIWSPEQMKYVTENKTEHIHALLKFEKGASLEKIAQSISIEPQYLQKIKAGRFSYDNCLAYLSHRKHEDKYQYPPEEVFTLRGEDYTSIYNRRIEAWLKGRATKRAKETGEEIDWLIEQILAGQISKSNILLTDKYYAVYGQYKRQINEAFLTVGERKSYHAIAELEDGRFRKTIIFISADSGVGKTRFSKQLINVLQRLAYKFGHSWEYCLTASTNAFDEYNGQEILFLDDIRGDSLTVSDWLKLLDPYMISPISARYHNKMGSAKVIIITSIKKPFHFFQEAKNTIDEDIGQYIRRIDYLVEINEDFILSKPMKQHQNENEYPFNKASFVFANETHYSTNHAMDKLVKQVIQNMKWNNNKKGISDTDQSSRDPLQNKK